ncbi:glutamate 5-kinase [Maribacter polysaccharolyticus]|uniref:glutamate 5-kinase n=1 Tax=Maribacter polysaccharolyticus TaxID=3020831 RepID=UPI00237F6D4B|nr:glutamate 5-kinase [Maribacter polysaccharolyticus]MDE3742916.1 glutamate 5-kinase [Maribacter polysaccharolyticus]
MDKKRILLKIGSNTLTKETNQISRGKIEDIARQIDALKDEYEFIIVSSGAIAAAKQFVKLEHNGEEIKVKQALAAIGQPHLMRIFQENFRELGLFTSQCLLSYSDFENPDAKANIKNTINVLVANNFIPIINENDTVATDEIQFGDNDKLAALTAALLKVDLLMIATNTDGVYTKESLKNETPETIAMVSGTQSLLKEISNSKSSHGTGGMQSKIEAASIAQKAGIATWIVNGLKDNFITDALMDLSKHTKIN